mgnify:FL=1|tara:strand:- start:8372 stop:9451 length:1080 start_codon:yes stop_codon:yes gene_type:complete
MKMYITICITCVGGRLIYDVIRALRDADDYKVKIIGIDSNPDAQGRLLCDFFELVPHSEEKPEEWLKHISNINKKYSLDGLIAFSEGETKLISKNRDFFKTNKINIAISQEEVVEKITDKYLMLSYLSEHGIDTGNFFLINSEKDIDNALLELDYPNKNFVLKPRTGRGSRGVLIADHKKNKFVSLLPERLCGTGSIETLKEQFLKKNISYEDYIAVPYYKGNVWDVDVLCKEGKIINICARVRQLKNPLWPTSTGHKVSLDMRILNYVKNICEKFKINGPADFDIVLDDKNKPKVLDAAVRYSGSVGVSYIAKTNMLSQLIRFMFDLPFKKFETKDGLILRPYITMAEIIKENEYDFL